jgi:hypothetical protein
MTRNPTNSKTRVVTTRLGAKMMYGERSGNTDSLRNIKTLRVTVGSQRRTNDPTHPAENDRRRTKLQTKHKDVSQNAANGNVNRGY